MRWTSAYVKRNNIPFRHYCALDSVFMDKGPLNPERCMFLALLFNTHACLKWFGMIWNDLE